MSSEEVGEPEDPQLWARQVLEFSKDLLLEAKKVCMPHTGEPVSVRIGIHSGDVVSGLIGTKLPKFSLFGDTMNSASRMESTGSPNRIHVSAATYALLLSCEDGGWEPTGGVQVKGKGFMQTYFWVPPGVRLVSPPAGSPISLSASSNDPTYAANTITTPSPDNSGFMALPGQNQAAGIMTPAGAPGSPYSPPTDATTMRSSSARSTSAAGHTGVTGGCRSSGENAGSSATMGAGVPRKSSERSPGSGSPADSPSLGSTYVLGGASFGRNALAHVGSRRVRHLSLDPTYWGARHPNGNPHGSTAPGALMVAEGQEDGAQPAGQGQLNAVASPRGAGEHMLHPQQAYVTDAPPPSYFGGTNGGGMAPPPSCLSRNNSSGMVRCEAQSRTLRSFSTTAARRNYRSSRRCLSHRFTSYNSSTAAGLPSSDGMLTSPRALRSGHGSLDQHLLRSRLISQSINSHPTHDLQHVMDSFHDFNHRAILDQHSPVDQHNARELALGNGSSGHDPLRVILRALPVQNMGATAFGGGQRTPSCIQSPTGQPLTRPKASVP
ncbi:hypothetical protein DUNSADRAFT_5744 [Dunaliella salina]|uniref:Guanylate cyclase domain-containing protein n=1 Tax=Dunaliella salina TaxID=3046 RepID=A0ABQ7H733_DUNSA|nr:hypothetical protein DUNSADRAFT_5744 [Dunaliella salina]|eukprot:KAF5842669.1 hypothetical protein DUNSADRAFT_5744 [Dunaliella salina]